MDIDISSLSISKLYAMYTSNLAWSLFLTSTALHAIALITSPIQAVYKWVRRRSSDSDTPVPYICAVVGSALWLRYSIFLRETKLILLQSYAVSMQLFFVVALIFFKSKRRKLLRFLSFLGAAMFLLFYYIDCLNEEEGREFTGQIASGAQILGSLVCPYLIYKAVTSKCIDFVPLAPVVFTWFMELHAIIYSIGIDDFYMLVCWKKTNRLRNKFVEFFTTIEYFPSVFGCFLLSMKSEEEQLANTIFFCMDGSLLSMFFIYPTEKQNIEKKENIATIM